MMLESFSKNAADLVRLRLALYGDHDAQALMLRCFKRSKADKVSERTVLACWSEQDDAINAALDAEGVPPHRCQCERCSDSEGTRKRGARPVERASVFATSLA